MFPAWDFILALYVANYIGYMHELILTLIGNL